MRQMALAQEKAEKEEQTLRLNASKYEEEDFEIFEPLYDGLDLN